MQGRKNEKFPKYEYSICKYPKLQFIDDDSALQVHEVHVAFAAEVKSMANQNKVQSLDGLSDYNLRVFLDPYQDVTV